jgi:predicted RNA-binding Zn ribbon-like protein
VAAPNSRVEELRFDAGSLALNLVATVGRRYGDPVERLGSVEHLHEWLIGVGLEVRGRVTQADLARVRQLREHVHELVRSAFEGRRPPTAAVAHVNAMAEAFTPRLRPTPTLDDVVALVAADAIRLVAGNDRAELRACDADDCRMLYVAHGDRARRWCSSEACGNRSRVAAHRARTKAA